MTTRSLLAFRRSARRPRAWIAVLTLAALLTGCDGGSGQSGTAFVFLSVDGFSVGGQSAVVVTASSSQTSFTSACVTIRNNLKNPTLTAPNTLDNVTIQSYTVTVQSVDGRTIVGPFTIPTSVLVPAGTAAQGVVSGNTATFGVVLIPAGSKPGGVPLNASAAVVFKGRDGRGSSVQTQGSIAVQVLKGVTDDSCSTSSTGGGTTTGTTTGGTTGTTTGTTTGVTSGTSTSI